MNVVVHTQPAPIFERVKVLLSKLQKPAAHNPPAPIPESVNVHSLGVSAAPQTVHGGIAGSQQHLLVLSGIDYGGQQRLMIS